LTKWRKITYSAGSLAAAVSYQAFSTYIIFFYVDTLKLSAKLVGLGMILYGIWNAINDPLAGQISDRTRTRWGRRVPYILFGTIPLALAFMLLWVPPFSVAAGQAAALFAYFLVAIFLFDLLFTFVVLNWTSLFPEQFRTLAERAQVSAYRQVFGIVGLILGVALPPAISGALGWGPMGVIFGIITAIALYVAIAGVKEKREFSLDPSLGLIEALSSTLRNRSFITLVCASMFINFSFVMLTATVPFYAKYVLGIGGNETTLLLGVAFLVALPSVYFWSAYAVKKGARLALLGAVVAFAAATTPFIFARSLVGGMLGTGLMGFGLAGLIVLVDILLADVVDEDELATGARREGMYFGINGFFIRLSVSLQAGVLALVLTATGYSANLPQQGPAAVAGLRALMSAVPVLGLALAFWAMRCYPLHSARLATVRERIETLHAEKAARAEQVG
jgi:GPH family glycoside/pentoside/hexuronide:cation symporter